jgi:hypothetical protein
MGWKKRLGAATRGLGIALAWAIDLLSAQQDPHLSRERDLPSAWMAYAVFNACRVFPLDKARLGE